MKIKYLHLLFLLLLGSTLWMSNNVGFATMNPAIGGATFAPNEVSCQTCHTAGSASTIQTSTKIEVFDTVTNKTVTSYEPGRVYKVRVTISKVSGTPAAYGFQMVSLLDNGDVDVKGWIYPSSGVKIVELTSGLKRMYVEQTKKNTNNFFETKWQAPKANNGSVTFYACGNGVNGNSLNTGDGASITNLKLTEGKVANEDINYINQFNIFPTIINDVINYNIDIEKKGNYNLKLISLDGRVLESKALELNYGSNQGEMNINAIKSGIYFLQLSDGQSNKVIKVIKE